MTEPMRNKRRTQSGVRFAALALCSLLSHLACAAASDDGLFGEPALDEVLFDEYRFPSYSSLDVLTQRNDNNRSGASHWTGVNQHSVAHFQKLGELTLVLGKPAVGSPSVVTGQPLYVRSALIHGVRQPVLIVATANNVIYAFSPLVRKGTAPTLLWSTTRPEDPTQSTLGPPLDRDVVFEVGEPCGIGSEAARGNVVGIEATPVVDVANNQILVGYKTSDTLQHLASIDLSTGRVTRSTVVQGPHPAANPEWHKLHRNRASLLLAEGVVYLGFSSLCEGNPKIMHGSLVAYDARTLDRVGEFQVTDDHTDGGGIWQGSTGPSADTQGNIYFVTGNRRIQGCLSGSDIPLNSTPPDSSNLTNSAVRLRIEKVDRAGQPSRTDAPTYALNIRVQTFFTPYRKLLGDCWDLDLGSGGALLIPGTRYLVAGGKEGEIYVLNRSSMGGFDQAGPKWEYQNVLGNLLKLTAQAAVADDPSHDRMHQKFFAGRNTFDKTYNVVDLAKWPHIHGTPVWARFDSKRAFMFVWPEKDTLKRFEWKGDRFDAVPAVGEERAPPNLEYIANGRPQNGTKNGMPGGMLSVNIDPTEQSLGVVLAAVKVCDMPDRDYANPGFPKCDDPGDRDSEERGILRAYDPFTMKQIWSNQALEPALYWFAKFVPPTIAEGRIFLPTASGKVLVYGP